jgi:tryptophan-rich sensory protein
MKKLVVSIVATQLAGAVGALTMGNAISEWYVTLVRPELAPPNWVFGPVWTLLYLLMGIALYLVWRKGLVTKGVRLAISLFVFQLVLNTLWSYLFFGLHDPRAAFIEIVLLWSAIVATIIVFARVSRTAAWLLAPYIAWVSFAAYLNYSFWMLNM